MTPTPTYIVTGATGGIGREIVVALTRDFSPCHIVLACRSLARASALVDSLSLPSGVTLEPRLLDLASLASVRQFADSIIDARFAVKGLINNAGIMPAGVTLTDDGLEITTQTNFLATALLTLYLIPSITDGGAIVFTTSITRYLPRLRADWREIAVSRHQRFVTYGRSKLMLTHFALHLSRLLADRAIRVNCSDPRVADTDILKMGHPIIDRLADLLLRPFIHTPAQGAAAAIRALTAQTSAEIFTLSASRPIPQKWLQNPIHQALIDDVKHYFQG